MGCTADFVWIGPKRLLDCSYRSLTFVLGARRRGPMGPPAARKEGKRDRRKDAEERHPMVPPDLFPQINNGENREHRQRDDLLHYLQFGGAVAIAAPSIRRHLQDIFEES